MFSQPKGLPQKIIIHSWDFDGMLASAFYESMMATMLKEAGDRPLNHSDYLRLAREVIQQKGYKEFFDARFGDKNARHILLVGSNRQSAYKDLQNGLKHNYKFLSSYPFYEALAQALQEQYKCDVIFDPIVLEDVAKKLDPGTTVQRVKKTMNKNGNYFLLKNSDIHPILLAELGLNFKSDDYYTDEEKGLLLYFQMHYAKGRYGRNMTTDFDFADDRNDIITELTVIYKNNLNMVPVYLTLTQFIPLDIPQKERPPQLANPIIFLRPENPDRNLDKDPIGTYHLIYKNAKGHGLHLYDENIYENTAERVYTPFINKIAALQNLENQKRVVRIIRGVLNIMESSTGIDQMSADAKFIDDPGALLRTWQATAVERLDLSYVGDKWYQIKRNPITERLYKALKEMNIEKISVESFKELENIYDVIKPAPAPIDTSNIQLAAENKTSPAILQKQRDFITANCDFLDRMLRQYNPFAYNNNEFLNIQEMAHKPNTSAEDIAQSLNKVITVAEDALKEGPVDIKEYVAMVAKCRPSSRDDEVTCDSKMTRFTEWVEEINQKYFSLRPPI